MPSAKFDVEMSGFRSGIAAAKNEVKTLDAQMKNLDATMKVQGKSEQTLSQQTETLNKRLAAQRTVAENAKNALDAMSREGIDAASDSYQRMARELLNAQTGMMETQAALNDLGSGAIKAAEGADKLETGLKGITKKISLDQVISGIDKISDGLKNAAKFAINLGESLFDAVMDKARLADDNATMALMYGIDLDTFLKMQGLVASGMDTSVDAILRAQTKLNKGIGDGKAQETLRELKITMSTLEDTGDGILEFVRKDPAEMFWEIGNAIMAMGDAYDKEAAAQNVFGRSWKELVPLFDKYKSLEEYKKALENVQTISEEENTSLADMADSFDKLHQKLDTLTTKILAQFAPGLTDLSESLSSLLSNILEYLETPEGKEALAGMAESITELFSGLKDISAEDAVNTFKTALDGVVSALSWLKENGQTVISVIEGLGAVWLGLKVGEGGLTLVKLVNGLKDLLKTGGENAAEAPAQKKTGFWKRALNNMGAMFMSDNFDATDMFLLGAKTNDQNRSTQENIEAWQESLVKNGLITQDKANKNLEIFKGLEAAVDVKPEVPDDAASSIAGQIGTVQVPAQIIPVMSGYVQGVGGGGGSGRPNVLMSHANGLPFVPYDGYLALLHQGERVMTATENRHYTYNSHNYFGNVNLNNGQDIENLCDRIDVHNRRQQAGYGG